MKRLKTSKSNKSG